MAKKNLFQCNQDCKTCTYEYKKPDGYDNFSECQTDHCPLNHYKIGYIDDVGGRHTEEGDWNPKGEYCSKCNIENCNSCAKWNKRQIETKKMVFPNNAVKTTFNWDAIFDEPNSTKSASSSAKANPTTDISPTPTTNTLSQSETTVSTPITETEKESIPENESKTKGCLPVPEEKTTLKKEEHSQKKNHSLFDDDIEFDLFKKNTTPTFHNNSSQSKNISSPILSADEENVVPPKAIIEEQLSQNQSSKKQTGDNVTITDKNKSETISKTPKTNITDSATSVTENTKLPTTKNFLDKIFKKGKETIDKVITSSVKSSDNEAKTQSNTKTETQTKPVLDTEQEKPKPQKQSVLHIKKKEKNEYLKDSWLDKNEQADIDAEGNIVQGIYRIDKDGNKKIVTVFDDDTNVRYVKTEKLSISTPLTNSDDTRTLNTTSDAWHATDSVEEDDYKYPKGIITSSNAEACSEVINIEQAITDNTTSITESDKSITPDIEDEKYDDEIDFGEDISNNEYDEFLYEEEFMGGTFEEDDDIPEPEEYKAEREEYENLGIQTEVAQEVDEEYEDADFEMDDTMKFKASLLAPIGEEIARLQLNNSGVILTVLGNCKITIKGRNDSDGFSYKDAKRFPKYIINRVLDKSIYRDPNMEVVDNTYFNITYFEIKSGEIVPIDDTKLDIKFDNPTPDNVKEVLYNEYKKFKNLN